MTHWTPAPLRPMMAKKPEQERQMTRQPLALIALLTLAACVQEQPADGRMLFMDNCAACHGADAMGDGELGAELTVMPPDLTRLAARNGGVFPRDYVMSTIDGYSRGSHFSAAMPEFGAGGLGPVVVVEDAQGHGIPVPANLIALADYLETVQRP